MHVHKIQMSQDPLKLKKNSITGWAHVVSWHCSSSSMAVMVLLEIALQCYVVVVVVLV